MPNNNLPRQYAYLNDAPGGPVQVHRGDIVTSFRGEDYTFEGVDRGAFGHSSGRVSVSRKCADAYDNAYGVRECPHMWHRNGVERSDYYPSVFGLYLGDAEGNEA